MRRRSNARRTFDRGKALKVGGIALGAGLLMFVIAYFVTVRVLFPPLPEPENGIVVPDLRGLTVPAAEARVHALGLRVTETSQIAHPAQAPGLVIAQSPLPGQQLRELGSVRLAVSSGLPRAQVPNVIGFTAERARAALAAVGFQADERVQENEAASGVVFQISPEVGSEQPVPSTVVVFVSSGPPPAPVDTMPPPSPDTVPLTRTNE